MAGYSGTPLAQKLGIKEGHRIALLGAAEGFAATLEGLPDGVHIQESLRGKRPFDVIVGFHTSFNALEAELPALLKRLMPAGGLWIAWPKRTSKVATDLTEDRIRVLALAAGVVDNKVCAIDDVWSGLRLVIRVKDRAKRPV